MANPSTIWAQLAIPNPAANSIPFVASDNVTIKTDVLNFMYNPTTKQLGLKYQITFGYMAIASAGTLVTCNATTGRVVVPPGSTFVDVNNNQIQPNSIFIPVIESQDTTGTTLHGVQIDTVNLRVRFILNAAATTGVTIAFVLVN